MIRYILVVIVIFVASLSSAQILKRQENETADMFVSRLKPDSTVLAHPVIETGIWNTGMKAILAFYGYDDLKDMNTGFNEIEGHLYLPTGNNTFRDVLFGPITEDGGYPEITSVFFTNADKDKSKELVVLCKYEQRHYDYEGDFYETFIFDNPSPADTLAYLQKVSEKFWGCECGGRDGKTETAKYKTAKDVKAGLIRMDF